MRHLFLDTAVLVAAVLPRDRGHGAATKILRRIADRDWDAATSDHVVGESLNFLQARTGRRDAAERLLALVFGSERQRPLVDDLLRIHSGRFAAALDLYRRHFDRGLSFTDCTTIAVMDELGIRDLATFGGGFEGLVGSVVRGG